MTIETPTPEASTIPLPPDGGKYKPIRHRVRFTLEDSERANEDWGFNCGPAALCAALNLTPAEIRPHLLDFENKGYTNPTLMLAVLKELGWHHRVVYRSDEPFNLVPLVRWGLMRVQWAGPWTKPRVPMRARYRQTHWVALAGQQVFDVNAMSEGGWIAGRVWSQQLVPSLIRNCVPRGTGDWWPTHALEVWP